MVISQMRLVVTAARLGDCHGFGGQPDRVARPSLDRLDEEGDDEGSGEPDGDHLDRSMAFVSKIHYTA